MKRPHFLYRALLLALCVSQALPNPAYALRNEPPGESKVLAGLEESLSKVPAAGLEEGQKSGVEWFFSPYMRDPERMRPEVLQRLMEIRDLSAARTADPVQEVARLTEETEPGFSPFELYAVNLVSAVMLMERSRSTGDLRQLQFAIEMLDSSQDNEALRAAAAGYDRMMVHGMHGLALMFWFDATADMEALAASSSAYARAIQENDEAGLPEGPALRFRKERIDQYLAAAVRAEEAILSVRGLRQAAGQRVRIAVFLEKGLAPAVTSDELASLQGLDETGVFPYIEVKFMPEDLDVRSFMRDEYVAKKFRVVTIQSLKPDSSADPDAVYLSGLPEGGAGIPGMFVPLMITEALGRWWQAQGSPEAQMLVLGAAPYLNATGLEESDFLDRILAGRFA